MTAASGGQPSDIDGREVMRAFVPASPLVQHLGIVVDELGDATARLSLPYADHLATVGDTVHGGAIAALADTAAMAASWSGTPAPASLRGSMVDLTVHYLAPAMGSTLVADARVLRRGRRLVHLGVAVSDASGSPVAHALATYQLG